MRRRLPTLLATAAVLLLLGAPARADQLIIKNPGDHPDYVFEAEPHGLVGLGGPFKKKAELGAGFRGTVVIVPNGFIKSINDSVGITFGGDFFFDKSRIFFPVGMQWNFWLSTRWSVFGEPGIGFSTKGDAVHPVLMAGGRLHFTERISLTMRVGYPAVSVGVSFFL